MARKRHIHKYQLRKLGKDKTYVVYACMLPGCNHYLEVSLAFGKETICWRCGNICTIPLRQTGRELVKPHCVKCTKVYPQHRKDKPQIDVGKLEDLSLDDLLQGANILSIPDEEED